MRRPLESSRFAPAVTTASMVTTVPSGTARALDTGTVTLGAPLAPGDGLVPGLPDPATAAMSPRSRRYRRYPSSAPFREAR